MSIAKNLRLDFRLAEGDPERLPELTEALVPEKVSVIYASGPAAARAAQQAARTIPIIAVGSDWPCGHGAAKVSDDLSSPLLFSLHKELGVLLLANRLLGICEWREMAASGCLASYGEPALLVDGSGAGRFSTRSNSLFFDLPNSLLRCTKFVDP